MNFLPDRSEVKIGHHYANSAEGAQKLIDDLRRKGFVATGIQTPGIYRNNKKK